MLKQDGKVYEGQLNGGLPNGVGCERTSNREGVEEIVVGKFKNGIRTHRREPKGGKMQKETWWIEVERARKCVKESVENAKAASARSKEGSWIGERGSEVTDELTVSDD